MSLSGKADLSQTFSKLVAIAAALRYSVAMSPDPDSPRMWVPNANVLVNAVGELIIKVELAALAKEDIELSIQGQRLTVSGRRVDPDGKGARYLVLELHQGPFESFFDVPDEFDLSRAQAAYQNGMLRVVAPRRTSTSLAR